jgi:4-hydroxy-4-methyl-2-oxoglutarate aldolase
MSTTLLDQLARVSFPTLGHFLEDGFADHGMRSLLANVRMIGRVLTLQLADANALAVNRALARIEPGDVVVTTCRAITRTRRWAPSPRRRRVRRARRAS